MYLNSDMYGVRFTHSVQCTAICKGRCDGCGKVWHQGRREFGPVVLFSRHPLAGECAVFRKFNPTSAGPTKAWERYGVPGTT